jgi:hypothetical protein
MKKLYSISELINENIALKKKIEKLNKQGLIGIISILKIMKGATEEERLKILRGFEQELEKL